MAGYWLDMMIGIHEQRADEFAGIMAEAGIQVENWTDILLEGINHHLDYTEYARYNDSGTCNLFVLFLVLWLLS